MLLNIIIFYPCAGGFYKGYNYELIKTNGMIVWKIPTPKTIALHADSIEHIKLLSKLHSFPYLIKKSFRVYIKFKKSEYKKALERM